MGSEMCIRDSIDVNPLDSICNSHVNLSENEDSVVSPTVVSSPSTIILRRSQRVRKPVVKLVIVDLPSRSELLILGEGSVIY